MDNFKQFDPSVRTVHSRAKVHFWQNLSCNSLDLVLRVKVRFCKHDSTFLLKLVWIKSCYGKVYVVCKFLLKVELHWPWMPETEHGATAQGPPYFLGRPKTGQSLKAFQVLRKVQIIEKILIYLNLLIINSIFPFL